MSHGSALPAIGERANTWTHFGGAVFALSSIWMVWPAVDISWQMAFGVIFFLVGMFMMFFCSTYYHWVKNTVTKAVMRKMDHISIYVMIASSYTPLCVYVVGGWVGWLMFGIQWAAVIGGVFYKVFAISKYPRLSLAIYLVMGWSILFIFPTVWERLSVLSLVLLFTEGVMYSAGSWFYAKSDDYENFHAIWHVFVLLGAIAHWGIVLTLLLQ